MQKTLLQLNVNRPVFLTEIDDATKYDEDDQQRGNSETRDDDGLPVFGELGDDAIILHSSGSTGRSKLIRRTNGQLMAEVQGVSEVTHYTNDDVFFVAVPLYHAYGFGSCFVASLHAHANLVLFPGNLPALLAKDKMHDALIKYGVTILPGVFWSNSIGQIISRQLLSINEVSK